MKPPTTRATRSRRASYPVGIALVIASAAALAGTAGPASAADEATAGTETLASTDPDPFAPRPLADEQEISIAIAGPAEPFIPLLLAASRGEFAKENLIVNVEIAAATDAALLMAQGSLDGTATSLNAGFLNLMSEGVPIRAVFPLDREPDDLGAGFYASHDVVGDDGFQPADLEGQRILVPSGIATPRILTLWTGLSEAGVDMTSIQFERFDHAQIAQALINGSAQVGLVVKPFHTALMADPCCLQLPYVTWQQAYYFFGPTIIDDRREAGEAFVRALARTTRDYLGEDYREGDLGVEIAALLEIPIDEFRSASPTDFEIPFVLDLEAADRIQQFFLEVPDTLTYTEVLPSDVVFDLSFVEQFGAESWTEEPTP